MLIRVVEKMLRFQKLQFYNFGNFHKIEMFVEIERERGDIAPEEALLQLVNAVPDLDLVLDACDLELYRTYNFPLIIFLK